MAASLSGSPANPHSSKFTAVIGDSAPHLTVFILTLLLLLYGYEIFNFSLSIDEELYGSNYEREWWLLAISQGRWGMGLLARVFPRFGDIPMIATVIFCAGLGLSACMLARILFRNHSAQYAFAGIFVSSPLWPHLAQFNLSSWGIAIGAVLVTFALLFILSEHRLSALWAACLLIAATGIYESFFIWFLVLLCVRHLAVLLGTEPNAATKTGQKIPWIKSGVVALVGLLGYLAVRHLLLAALSLELTYVQGFVKVTEFSTQPKAALAKTLLRSWNLVSGGDPIFLGYGFILTLLPLLGLLVMVVRLLWLGLLKVPQRLLGIAILCAAIVIALSLLVVSAGSVPSRALTSWIPISAFLAGVAFSYARRFEKVLYVLLGASLFVSVWVSVSLFYTDHLARQRDEVLATRIMARVDNILPDPQPGPVPFFVVGAVPASPAGPFRKLEIFGDSYFDSAHEGGNPWRIAAYLRIIGINTLEPHSLSEAVPYRPVIETMPIWPAAGSIAMVDRFLVIKLGPLN